jgi:hypothetical protein
VKFCTAFEPTPLFALKVRVYVPLVPLPGVPLRVPVPLPLFLNVTPFGNVPDSANDGIGKPVVVTVNDPATPTVNVVLVALVMDGGMPTVSVKVCTAYSNNNNILQTNRLRLKFDAQVADNVSVAARLSMYKVFGDSSGIQVFNGQPNTLNIDGTTARVPTGDMVRVERVYFNWNNIGGSKLYLSIGRRPSTDGPPWTYRQDEPRGGTPSGSLIDYQFDGITVGCHINEKVALRMCYGQGYESGFGNGNLLKTPADRLRDVHFFGGNFDLYTTDKTFIQSTIARAWNVTDGFNGLTVLPNNPLTGDLVQAPVIMRFTPSANLGAINLYGLNVQRTLGQFDLYVSGNWVSMRPNGETTTLRRLDERSV